MHGLQKGPGKFFMGVLESFGKILDLLVSERVGNCIYYPLMLILITENP